MAGVDEGKAVTLSDYNDMIKQTEDFEKETMLFLERIESAPDHPIHADHLSKEYSKLQKMLEDLDTKMKVKMLHAYTTPHTENGAISLSDSISKTSQDSRALHQANQVLVNRIKAAKRTLTLDHP